MSNEWKTKTIPLGRLAEIILRSLASMNMTNAEIDGPFEVACHVLVNRVAEETGLDLHARLDFVKAALLAKPPPEGESLHEIREWDEEKDGPRPA